MEYVQLSQDFLNSSLDNGYDIYRSEQGYTFVYDQSTNTFGLYNPDGTTTTFYKPVDGANYMNEQIEKYNLERVNN
jgi:pyocin large subunit-like protein